MLLLVLIGLRKLSELFVMKFVHTLKMLFVVFCFFAATTVINASAYAAGPVSVADLAERLLGAVVNISTSQNIKGSAPAQDRKSVV